jgi:hypothetical protein
MKTITPILAVGVALIFGACDSRQEEARKDALENRADSIEDKAKAVEKSGEAQSDALKKEADRTRDLK